MDSFELKVGTIRYEGKGVLVNQVGSNYLGTKESPIVVHVDTDTDWPTIIPAGAGVVVALLVAWLTIGMQRNQIQGSISNFRQQWMSELREVASELIQLMVYLVNMNSKNQKFKHSEDYYKACARSAQLRARVELLFSRDDDRSAALRKAGAEALDCAIACKYGGVARPSLEKIKTYKNLLRFELEQAWLDAKRDLGLNKRFVFFNLLKK